MAYLKWLLPGALPLSVLYLGSETSPRSWLCSDGDRIMGQCTSQWGVHSCMCCQVGLAEGGHWGYDLGDIFWSLAPSLSLSFLAARSWAVFLRHALCHAVLALEPDDQEPRETAAPPSCGYWAFCPTVRKVSNTIRLHNFFCFPWVLFFLRFQACSGAGRVPGHAWACRTNTDISWRFRLSHFYFSVALWDHLHFSLLCLVSAF